jgi:hypothetical protein
VSFESVGRNTDPRQARPEAARIGHHEERRATRPWHLGTGTLACPDCDAPVILRGQRAGPADLMQCPFCDRAGAVRDFLSLAAPARAPRVHVLVRT